MIRPQDGADIRNKYIDREMETLMSVSHKHIVTLLGVCLHSHEIYLITEFVKGGDLKGLLKDGKVELEWTHKLKLILQTGEAIRYLHTRCILHRDLKAENILIDLEYNVKVADFGFARTESGDESKMMTVCGTQRWMAPEVAMGNKYSYSADVFSFGVVVYEIITRKDPPLRSMQHDFFAFNTKAVERHAPVDTPVELWMLMCSCLEFSRTKRALLPDIIAHLKQIKSDVDNIGVPTVPKAPRSKQQQLSPSVPIPNSVPHFDFGLAESKMAAFKKITREGGKNELAGFKANRKKGKRLSEEWMENAKEERRKRSTSTPAKIALSSNSSNDSESDLDSPRSSHSSKSSKKTWNHTLKRLKPGSSHRNKHHSPSPPFPGINFFTEKNTPFPNRESPSTPFPGIAFYTHQAQHPALQKKPKLPHSSSAPSSPRRQTLTRSTKRFFDNNLKFYSQKTSIKQGEERYTIDEVHLEFFYDWQRLLHPTVFTSLFPTSDFCDYQQDVALLLNRSEAKQICENFECGVRVCRSYRAWLSFLGLKLLDFYTGKISILKWCYEDRHTEWKTNHKHTNQKIGIMLKSLTSLGFSRYVKCFVNFIRTCIENNVLTHCKKHFKKWKQITSLQPNPSTSVFFEEMDRNSILFTQFLKNNEQWESSRKEWKQKLRLMEEEKSTIRLSNKKKKEDLLQLWKLIEQNSNE